MTLPFHSSFTARQVYIRMKPPPRNLAQSRKVYKALQKFGEISSFLNLKHHQIRTPTRGRTAFAIFETSQAAENAITASPFTVSLTDPDPSPRSFSPPTSSTARPKEKDIDSDSYANDHDHDYDHTDSSEPGSISCELQTSGYDHKVGMRLNPYHMGFLISRDWYEVHDLLERQVKGSAPMIEYADCFTRRKGSMPYRVQDSILKENEEKGATSLMKLYRRGLERKKEEEKRKTNDQPTGGIKEGN